MAQGDSRLDQLCVNTIRTLSIDAVQNANSGHPGLPMGAAPMTYALWQCHLRHDPKRPDWPDRDRFVLSAGHGSMLLYSMLHLTGYDVSLDDVRDFRQWGSKTPGHPESHETPGVEATTGPLGQGTANAVGMAMAERRLAALFNRPGHEIVDHMTYCLVGDGDLMEGISAEAASLAGHLGLGKLIYLYDANQISLDGPISLTFTEDVAQRYASYGWQILHVENGDTDVDGIDAAIAEARAETARPTLMIVRTTIGYGSPNKAGTSDAHGSPLGPDEVALAKKQLGWDPEKSFFIPTEAGEHLMSAVARGQKASRTWDERFGSYAQAHPDLAKMWQQAWAGELPSGWDQEIPQWEVGSAEATRSAGGKILNAIATQVPWLWGGDADLSVSTKTALKDAGSFDGQSGEGRNIHYGVREHAMGAIANGIAYHGGLHSFTATFFCFADYMRPAARLAALVGLPVTHVYTHDSIALGEDGPTHQPVEHLMSLRVMPNMTVLRPADSNEAAAAWKAAMQQRHGPTSLVFSRQKLATLDLPWKTIEEGVARGAYVVRDPETGAPDVILIATGSEVQVALDAQQLLAAASVSARVVSMPSWELFAQQPRSYQQEVLPESLPARVSVEAGVTLGWQRWTGAAGAQVGVDRFGASAPGSVNLAQLGITPEAVVAAVRTVLGASPRTAS